MTEELDEERISITLEEVRNSRDSLKEYLEFTNCPEFQLGVVGKKEEYGIIVYISNKVDTTFIIPLEIDGVQIRVCRVEDPKLLSEEETSALARWYDSYCSITEEPILEGPCCICGTLGYWEVDPFIEDVHNREEWNLFCHNCYTARSRET